MSAFHGLPTGKLFRLIRHLLAVFAFLQFGSAGSALAAPPTILPSIKCEALAGNVMRAGSAHLRITSAKVVSADTASPYCEVQGYVASQVGFELRLPLARWTQRLLFTGCGGFCGQTRLRLGASEGCAPAQNGEFAMVSSNLGHQTAQDFDLIWSEGNPQAITDWGSRGVHVVTLAARAIVARFYGTGPRFAYFVGCSDGGREAMMAVQRYPKDFDGVIAGAPVINVTTNNSLYHAWIVQHLLNRDGSNRFSDDFLSKLAAVVVGRCDARDGMRDGLVADPEKCHFSPRSIVCAGQAPAAFCLTSEQAQAIEALYAGPAGPDGKPLYFGLPRGSEENWNRQAGGSLTYGTSFTSFLGSQSYSEPRDLWDVLFSPASLRSFAKHGAELNALDANLEPFRKSGGKLLMWHGWADNGVPPGSSVAYFKAVTARLGTPAAQQFLRLYMLPGVGHCGGGRGPSKIDLLTPLMAWVEDGKAPTAVVARGGTGNVDDAWQVAPYPAAPVPLR